MGNTTDIKLADRFSRAVNFSFFDKVTRLAGWQVVFFKIKIKIKYARRCAYYLMHTCIRYRYHSLLCTVDYSFLHFHSLNKVDTRNPYRVLQTDRKLQLTSNPLRFLLLPKSPQSNLQILSLFQRPPIPIIRTLTRPLHTRPLPTLS